MKVAYEVAGPDGAEPVLLVAGLGQTKRRWHRVARLLATDHRVVTFDNREVGGTGPSPGPFTLADVATDALELMTALGFHRFLLVGHSMGGMIAQEIIRLGGADRVRAAVLLSTTGGASIAVPGDPTVLMPSGDGRPTWAKLAAPGFHEANRAVIDEEHRISLEQATPPEAYMRQIQAIQLFDPGDDDVRATGVPVVVGHGDQDPLVPYENGVRLADRLGVELVTWKGVGHVVDCEVPTEVAALARRHFAGR